MTSKNAVQRLIVASLLSTPGIAHAHSGHDHNHWFSDINHALFYVAIAAVIGTGVLLVKARRKSTIRKGEHQE